MLASICTLRQISVSVTTAASCLIVGFSALYYQQIYDFKRWSETSVSQAISIIDQALDYSIGINEKMLGLGNLSCDEVRPTLRDAVATTPYVRTVNVIRDDFIYCGSYTGDKKIYMPGDYHIKLVSGTPMMPTRGGLVIKSHAQDMAAVSVIDAIYIKILLGMAVHNNALLINVEDAWIDMSGAFFDEQPNIYDMFGMNKKSEKYPYSIYATYGQVNFLDYFIKNNGYVVMLLVFISALLSAYTWYRTGQPLSLQKDLQRAVKNNEFVPYLQPLVDGQTGALVGAEVLVRWMHPQTGLITPDFFISQAETSGLINTITSSLMQQVSTKLSTRVDDLPASFHIGFNISAQQCHSSDLLVDCKRFISHFPRYSNILFLELTERTLLEDDVKTRDFFSLVKGMGIKLALDDFGTGQSSLAYLQKFSFDYLKIDKQFVSMIDSNAISSPLLDTLIDLAENLDMILVAEGVETIEQKNYLSSKGVSMMQGYLIGKPIPIDEFVAAWL